MLFCSLSFTYFRSNPEPFAPLWPISLPPQFPVYSGTDSPSEILFIQKTSSLSLADERASSEGLSESSGSYSSVVKHLSIAPFRPERELTSVKRCLSYNPQEAGVENNPCALLQASLRRKKF